MILVLLWVLAAFPTYLILRRYRQHKNKWTVADRNMTLIAASCLGPIGLAVALIVAVSNWGSDTPAKW